MNDHMPIYVGESAIEEFVKFSSQAGYQKFFFVADENTYKVLGERVVQAIQDQGWDVLCQVLNPEHLHTDDFSITRVLATYDAEPRLFVAVGSPLFHFRPRHPWTLILPKMLPPQWVD